MGSTGDSWASVLGTAAGVGRQQFVFLAGRARVRIRLQGVRADRHVVGRILRVALSTRVKPLMAKPAQTVIMWLVVVWVTTVLAGHNVTSRIFGLMGMVSMELGGEARTLVGPNLSARRPDRAERSAWIVGGIAMALVPLPMLAPQADHVLSRETDVIAVALTASGSHRRARSSSPRLRSSRWRCAVRETPVCAMHQY